MADLVIQHTTIVTAQAAGTVWRDHDLHIRDDKIVAIGQGLDVVGAEVIDGSGAFVLPGLIDTHMHMWEYAWRGTLERKLGGPDYLDYFEPTRGQFTPEDTFDSVVGCGIEMLDHGITGVLDFFHGANRTREHVDAAVAAHRLTGQRVLLSYGSTGVYGAARADFEAARQSRLIDFERLHRASADFGPLIDIGLALVTPAWGNFPAFREEVGVGRSLGVPMTFHANETGEFLTIGEAGLLGPDLVPSHGNRASDVELRLLAEAGTLISTTPQSETGSGKSLGVVRRGLQVGVEFGLGIDTPPSVAPLNLFGQVRLLFEYLQLLDNIAAREGGRFPIDLRLDRPSASLDTLLRMATANGAKAIGLPDRLGTLAPGQLADVILIRPHDPDVALLDPVAYAVLGQPSKHEVELVVVGGVVRKRDGQLVGVDREAVAEANRAVRRRVLTAIGRPDPQ
jgi:cytosine/adenosine deaminase-related metal-dependent hydrolase